MNLECDKVAKNTQFYMTMPQGIEVEFDEDEEAYLYEEGDILPSKPSVTVDKDSSGDMLVAIYKNGKQTYKAESGTIIILPLIASENIQEGTYQIRVHDIEVGDANGAFDGTETETTFEVVVDKNVFTGIRNINVDSANQKVYTVGGQRVTSKNLKKGIYVVDGKKVTVK